MAPIHYLQMVMDDDLLASAVRRGLRLNPASTRAWALDAGLHQTTLSGIAGERHGVSADAVLRLADAAGRRAWLWRRVEGELREALLVHSQTSKGSQDDD